MSSFADHSIDIPPGASGNVRARCPECHPKRSAKNRNAKDLSVEVTKGTWYCHHCGWAGSLTQADWRDGVSPDTGYQRGNTMPDKIYRMPERAQTFDLPQAYRDVFAARGIPDEAVQAAGITMERRKCPECGVVVDALAIPYRRDGQTFHIKYRHNGGGKRHFWSSYDTEREFYGLDDLIDASTGVIVEGELDKITVDVVGGWSCASVPDGAPSVGSKSYSTKFDFLLGRAEGVIAALGTVILAVDTDRAGDVLADELARRIGPEKCYRVAWPDGCKDANETLVAHGADAVSDAIRHAAPYPVAGIFDADDVWADVERRYEHGTDPGVRIGMKGLDELVRWRRGLFGVVTGMPSHGKSIFLDEVAARLARQHGWVIGLCSPENQPLADHLSRIAAHVIGKPFNREYTGQGRMSLDELRAYKAWFKQHYKFILPASPSIDEILRLARIEVYRSGMSLLIIDPWTEIEHRRPAHMSETDYAAQEISKLSRFAKDHGVLVVLVAHPAKMRRDVRTKKYPVPALYDISGSAAFRNKCDFGICVHRIEADPSSPTEVHVQKIRFRDTGRQGVAEFWYDRATERFTDVLGDSADGPLAGDPWDSVPIAKNGHTNGHIPVDDLIPA